MNTKKIPNIVKNDPYLAPHSDYILEVDRRVEERIDKLKKGNECLSDFANGHKFYGLKQHNEKHWVFREWAPNATAIYFLGEFNNWSKDEAYRLEKRDNGVWQIEISKHVLKHLDYYKLCVCWNGGEGHRIPAYANYVVQDENTHQFCARVWAPADPYQSKYKLKESHKAPLIYESHVGMAQIEGRVNSYDDYIEHTLDRIVKANYNTVQLMAIQEHPYYGSFGYQVSNFFAPSSRCGTPDDLKRLIDEAHKRGLRVIMDIVHSHAVKNELEGISCFDGTHYQYFHAGERGNHSAWDTRCFDYGKEEVIHFLLSNCKYWVEEFGFDGFRFDGITSMLYHHHGLGKGFNSYADYFGHDTDIDALVYLKLASKLIHEVNKDCIVIAEDMSGMPGLATPVEDGGIGFDYRLAMGIPDFWVKIIKEYSDENWSVEWMWHELTNRRKDEKVISYVESHDQALVGDKTVIFRLLDKEMYDHMNIAGRNHIIDRGIALHKMLRLITLSTARGGYLNFMGNEFGHPEWIDFPREGNGWSYHHARRQWNLVDNDDLCYKFLNIFDKEIINFANSEELLELPDPDLSLLHCDDKVVGYSRGKYLFIFNFNPSKSYTNYMFKVSEGRYSLVLSSDNKKYGGMGRLPENYEYQTYQDKISLYLPTRTAIVLEKIN